MEGTKADRISAVDRISEEHCGRTDVRQSEESPAFGCWSRTVWPPSMKTRARPWKRGARWRGRIDLTGSDPALTVFNKKRYCGLHIQEGGIPRRVFNER